MMATFVGAAPNGCVGATGAMLPRDPRCTGTFEPPAAPGSASCCSSSIGLCPDPTARPRWQNELRHPTPIAGLPALSSTNRATYGVDDWASASTAESLLVFDIGVRAPAEVSGVTNASQGFAGLFDDLRKTQ